MNWITIAIGTAAIVYGLYTGYARNSSPESFKKLEPMKKFWGEKAGYWVHVVGYTVVPIVFGLVMAFNGVMGGSFF